MVNERLDNKLIDQLNKLGYPLFESTKDDINEIIANVVKSNDLRILEGFPVILANAVKKGNFNYNDVLEKLKEDEEKLLFIYFLLLSLSIYKDQKIKFSWAEKLHDELSEKYAEKMNDFRVFIKENRDFKIFNYQLNPERIKNIFLNYFVTDTSKMQKKTDKYKDLSLEYALSQVFSNKQKSLFFKKLNGEKLTKTEGEYYSRTVKKKLLALANSELHRLSRQILER